MAGTQLNSGKNHPALKDHMISIHNFLGEHTPSLLPESSM